MSVLTLGGHKGNIRSIIQLTDLRLCSGSHDGTIKLWDIDSGRCTKTLGGRQSNAEYLRLTQHEHGRVVSGSVDGLIQVWNVQDDLSSDTDPCLQTLRGHTQWVMGLCTLFDGHILSGSRDATAKLWDPKTGQCISTFRHPSYEKDDANVNWVMQLSDGRVCTASNDTSLLLWDLREGRCVQKLVGHKKSVFNAIQLNDGRLCSCGDESVVLLWDLVAGKTEQSVNSTATRLDCLVQLPDSSVCTGGWDGNVQIWDIKGGQCVNTLRGHADGHVWSMTLLSDGRICSSSEKIKIWTEAAPIQAMMRGDVSEALRLIEERVDIDIRTNDVSPLEYAFTMGVHAAAESLLKQGCSLHKAFDTLKRSSDALVNVNFSDTSVRERSCALWFEMIQRTEDGCVGIAAQVHRLVSRFPELRSAKDAQGRLAVDVCTSLHRDIMNSVVFWHSRYRLLDERAEHTSATCKVFRAVDERDRDPVTDTPRPVALKLMRVAAQFQREMDARASSFDAEFVVPVLRSHWGICELPGDDGGDPAVTQMDSLSSGFSKEVAESLYCLVMPLADRNLFVALKQERFAGHNLQMVAHVFAQIVRCVEHVHSRGILHGDLKPLNVVRTNGVWMIIDLDASAALGVAPVGSKSSSAYVPPEAIFADTQARTAEVKSEEHRKGGKGNGNDTYDLVIAHPSFDVWSLGVVLYQLCTATSLFKESQDDNLSDDFDDEDSLFTLAEWRIDVKMRKLQKVRDHTARNLLAQMLMKDPTRRPTLARVLVHPFVSGKKVARLAGEDPKYDVFLSYRVASDGIASSHKHVEILYDLLIAQGIRVYWDVKCLTKGVNWEQGFCEGLVSSRIFVSMVSREAINHPSQPNQSFASLQTNSPCDNVLLEMRLAVELQWLGYIERVFPVFIGDCNAATGLYSNYFGTGCHPKMPDLCVQAVEDKLRHHMESQALGTPLEPDRSVVSVVNAITAHQGTFIEGERSDAFMKAVEAILQMVQECEIVGAAEGAHDGIHKTTAAAVDRPVPASRMDSGGTAVPVSRPPSAESAAVAIAGATAAGQVGTESMGESAEFATPSDSRLLAQNTALRAENNTLKLELAAARRARAMTIESSVQRSSAEITNERPAAACAFCSR